jgi:hypothetical protein
VTDVGEQWDWLLAALAVVGLVVAVGLLTGALGWP